MNKLLLITVCVTVLLGCKNQKDSEMQSHPLGNNLIPNVEIISSKVRYAIPQRLEYHNISGLGLGIIEDKKLVFTKGYGFAVKNKAVPDSSTIFQVGSISKSILGLITLILEERGEIVLDTLAISYLNDWRFPENNFGANKKITLRHLLNHTAGLNMFNSWGMSPYQEPMDLVDVFDGNEFSKGVSVDTIPGALYKYSNYGFGIVQMILENHTGKSLEQLSRELIFEPLGMERSSFKKVVPSEILEGYAFAHDDNANIYEEYWTQPLIPGSGGLMSTVKDLSILLLAIQKAFDGEQQGFITPQIVGQIILRKGYNLGFEIEGEGKNLSMTHTGRVKGFFAYMRLYPNTGKGLIMLCNSDNGGELFKDILRGASEYYEWDILKPKMIDPLNVSVSDLKKYSGDYEITIDATKYIAQFYIEEGHLTFKMKDEDDSYPLRMTAPNYFVDLIDGSTFDFEVKDSTISAFTLDEDLTFTKAH